MNKLIVILGPTSSGKSSLAIKLAQKFHGEIISADSRQVYKGMDIGTGKVTKPEQKLIKHYLLDVADPKKQFTVSDFKKLGNLAIKKIQAKKKLPFLVGGTPFYIYSLIDDWNIPEVKPNPRLRKLLEKKSPKELFKMLQKLDPVRAANIDRQNSVRLIRAIEIVKTTGKPVPVMLSEAKDLKLKVDSSATPQNDGFMILGIKKDQNELYKLIDRRLDERLKLGLVNEVKKLLKQKISHQRLKEFGLEYRFVSLYLQNLLTYDEMVLQLKNAIHKFSKRQMTWFKRDSRIQWITSQSQAEKLIKQWIKKTS